eukprot:scaffold97241_cov36-Phaeocystis_antarctica.AAC.1
MGKALCAPPRAGGVASWTAPSPPARCTRPPRGSWRARARPTAVPRPTRGTPAAAGGGAAHREARAGHSPGLGLELGLELGTHHWRAADGRHAARRRGGGGQRVLREQIPAWAGAHLDLGTAAALAHCDHARRHRVEFEVQHRAG